MIRVLHIVNKWQIGGTERFIENLISANKEEEIAHSILSICTDVTTSIDCSTIGPLHNGEGMIAMLKGSRKLSAVLENAAYDVVHIHTQNSSGFLYASIAKNAGIPCRIIHSHNSRLGARNRIIKAFLQPALRKLYADSETIRLACSETAGLHLFKDSSFTVIPNGIDLRAFEYREETRTKLLEKMRINTNAFIIGCVGMFVPVKNHIRSISIFNMTLERIPNSYLILVGDGELKNVIETEIEKYDLNNRVIILGCVNNIEDYYNIFDVLLFPSLYEGFPLALVEAQCNGLPIVASDTISPEVALTDLITFESLDSDDDKWVDDLGKKQRCDSRVTSSILYEKGFSNERIAETLNKMYLTNQTKMR